jgi:hypothetical protein
MSLLQRTWFRPLTSTSILRPSAAFHFDSVSNFNPHHKGSILATPITQAGPRYLALSLYAAEVSVLTLKFGVGFVDTTHLLPTRVGCRITSLGPFCGTLLHCGPVPACKLAIIRITFEGEAGAHRCAF